MRKPETLGQFEQLVLSAVVLLQENAYGIAVAEKVTEVGDRVVKLGAVYQTLDRLEDKGYVKSWLANPTPERGGREKRYFKLTRAGEKALAHQVETSKRITDALMETGLPEWVKRNT